MTRTPVSLLERLRTRPDQAAWDQFVQLYGPLIHRWLCEFRLQHHDACDLGQDVLVTLAREMPNFRYDPGRGSFRGWLRNVVTNRLLGYWRERDRQRVVFGDGEFQKRLAELEDSASGTFRRWDEEHDSYVVNRVLALLRTDFEPATWQAFWRVVMEGEKPASVSAALGISVNAVHLAKARVLRRLKQEIDGLLD
jgi:RNA polymerase sigma-70 factor (ECF subfamily)